MEKFRQSLLVPCVLLAIAAVSVFVTSRPAIAQGPPDGLAVQIVNPLPVPVTGAVGLTGPITVSLNTGSHVTVDNTVASPVRVRSVNDAIQPAQAKGTCNSPVGTIGCSTTLYAVPAGKRLVIEYASVNSCSLPGQIALMSITTSAGGQLVTHSLTSTRQATSPGSSAIGCNGGTPSSETAIGEQVRLYADAGTFVGVEVTRDSTVGVGSYVYTMSGYLVDIPFAP